MLSTKKLLRSLGTGPKKKGCGTFGMGMTRDRFTAITRFLHFSDNEHASARKDRAWNLRPALAAGYILGSTIAIDVGILPSRNRHNPTWTNMKDKPRKRGS